MNKPTFYGIYKIYYELFCHQKSKNDWNENDFLCLKKN